MKVEREELLLEILQMKRTREEYHREEKLESLLVLMKSVIFVILCGIIFELI